MTSCHFNFPVLQNPFILYAILLQLPKTTISLIKKLSLVMPWNFQSHDNPVSLTIPVTVPLKNKFSQTFAYLSLVPPNPDCSSELHYVESRLRSLITCLCGTHVGVYSPPHGCVTESVPSDVRGQIEKGKLADEAARLAPAAGQQMCKHVWMQTVAKKSLWWSFIVMRIRVLEKCCAKNGSYISLSMTSIGNLSIVDWQLTNDHIKICGR